MTKLDLGQLFLYQNEVLITRSSQQILFFRRMFDKKENLKTWK